MHVGALQRTLEVKTATKKVITKDVVVPRGNAELWAKITRNGKSEDPYHVVLIRK